MEDLVSIPLNDGNAEHAVQIGSNLGDEVREQLVTFLRRNADVFAWTPADMPEIDAEVMEHRLAVDPKHRPIKKMRHHSPKRQKGIAEVGKLLKARFIREVNYPTWVSNVVLVKKANNKWRMCIDFKKLNKACPKDSYPLPRIDQLMDVTSGYELLTFIDAFSGYNQIQMAPEDEEKTTFVTDCGLYCYRIMPFGLKNVGATYQCLVNKIFKEQIGRNMEVYVDDMLVKSRASIDHLADLEETFGALRKHKIKLNPSKCAFGVTSEKFLGFMVSRRGIEENPEKIRAI
ncbi:putative RVT_1 domain-containing protein [Cocos nucifera]|uniref:Putative RVT_1 domain-containing protein n=1 Tax=Cocos nucifera TaxID=13894 RepID=A0A8K0N3C6_COCNU|nr:putative RVT_1 domain-containing protein [Cocos nucifera]